MQVRDVVEFLESLAPPALADEWDNVGLLLGDANAEIRRALTCLTLTPAVAAEAVKESCGLIVTHHPILFRAVKRLTTETPEGGMILELARAGVAVYSAHTGYDSAPEGINAQLASVFKLRNVQPLRPVVIADSSRPNARKELAGGGRYGDLPKPLSLDKLLSLVKERLAVDPLPFVGDEGMRIGRVAVACGSAAEFLVDAHRAGCHALITGEARFHACLEAQSLGMALILPGHYATERPSMEHLAKLLSDRFPSLQVAASQSECDPVRWS